MTIPITSLLDRFKVTTFNIDWNGMVTLGTESNYISWARQIKRDMGRNPTGQKILDWILPRMVDEVPVSGEDDLRQCVMEFAGLFSDIEIPSLTDEERQIIANMRTERQEYSDSTDADLLGIYMYKLIVKD
jgi:hypothetical protein